jgi:uncharacterized oligopeptide transporter (OPT) family protein
MERNERDDTKVENDHDLEDDHGHRKKDKKEEQEEELSVERIFENQEVPSWRNQLTLRALVVSFVLSILFCVIVMKLNLTTGIIPSLNVSAGLLGFFFIKTLTKFLEKSGLLKQPFTRQENTVIQTCVVASSGIAFSGILSVLFTAINFHFISLNYFEIQFFFLFSFEVEEISRFL